MSKRLFIAIKLDPSEEMLRRIRYFKKNLQEENINWIKTEHFHLTLKFLGKTSGSKIEELSRILKEVADDFQSFEMTIKDVALFGSQYSPRVIWLGVEPEDLLKRLNQKIVSKLQSIAMDSDRQNFVPHLSIARIRKIHHKIHFKQVFEKAEQGFIQSQKVGKIILFESILLAKGAEYAIVEEFPLGL